MPQGLAHARLALAAALLPVVQSKPSELGEFVRLNGSFNSRSLEYVVPSTVAVLFARTRRNVDMKTGDTVTDLGLYASECCSSELIFDTGDRLTNCPLCNRPCVWELEEELVTQDDFERLNGVAA
jgi:hypothetical protein